MGNVRIGEHGGSGGDEQLRDLVVVEILPDREVRRGAERWNRNATFSSSTSLRTCSTVLGGL